MFGLVCLGCEGRFGMCGLGVFGGFGLCVLSAVTVCVTAVRGMRDGRDGVTAFRFPIEREMEILFNMLGLVVRVRIVWGVVVD